MKTIRHKAAPAADLAAIERPRISPAEIVRLVPPSYCTHTPKTPALDLADRLIGDPGSSHWLRAALVGALRRDLVDAANDCELVLSVLLARLAELEEVRS
jgi:hypothetical protein